MSLKKEKFWSDKTPCWEIRGCVDRQGGAPDCPAYKNQSYPCWGIKGTICKGEGGTDVYICSLCKVYGKYGEGRALSENNVMERDKD